MLGSRFRGIPGEPEEVGQQRTRNHISTVTTGAPCSRDNGFDPFLVVGHVNIDSRKIFATFQTPAYHTHQDPDTINVARQRSSGVTLRERKARVQQWEGLGWGWGALSVRRDGEFFKIGPESWAVQQQGSYTSRCFRENSEEFWNQWNLKFTGTLEKCISCF